MLIPTGKQVVRPCKTCGRELEHREGEAHTHPDDGSEPKWVAVWTCDAHDAPCGLPCLGGGVSGKVYRSKNFHVDGCAKCNAAQDEDEPCFHCEGSQFEGYTCEHCGRVV